MQSILRESNSEVKHTEIETLFTLLDGCTHATTIGSRGTPLPIKLPDDPIKRRPLIEKHVKGLPGEVIYAKIGEPERPIDVDPVVLGALCPGADRLCRYGGFDLDSSDGHGANGLSDPSQALRVIAERADRMGILPGMLAVTSKSGRGRHCWFLLPSPTPIENAVHAIAGLIASAMNVATQDAEDSGLPHAFRTGTGEIARPGQKGAVELFPYSTTPPERGWPLTLPFAGAHRERGGGIAIDPFTGHPITLTAVSRCPAAAWATLVRDSKLEYQRRTPPPSPAPPSAARYRRHNNYSIDRLARLDPRTHEFLAGTVQPGGRNAALYTTMCNLLGWKVEPIEAENMALAAALRCGLSEVEARNTIRSAIARKRGAA